MSKKVCGSSPSFSASTNASQVAAMVAPSSMLLQIFAAWPAPASPAWITALPICSRNGRARSNPPAVPPTMKVNVPASAAAIPPDTGASTMVKPAALASASTDLAVATSIVEQSIRMADVGAFLRMLLR